MQVSCFEDVELHKKYNFITYLLSYINTKHPGGGFNLDGKIKATNFVQKKNKEHTKPNLVAQPVMKLLTAESFGLTEAKVERLSQIIAEINSRIGKAYDNEVAVKAMLQIKDILMILMLLLLMAYHRIRISSHCYLVTMKLRDRCLVFFWKKYTRACTMHK